MSSVIGCDEDYMDDDDMPLFFEGLIQTFIKWPLMVSVRLECVNPSLLIEVSPSPNFRVKFVGMLPSDTIGFLPETLGP